MSGEFTVDDLPTGQGAVVAHRTEFWWPYILVDGDWFEVNQGQNWRVTTEELVRVINAEGFEVVFEGYNEVVA